MAKVSAVIRNRPNKNNQYKVEISVHHNKCTSYIDSGMFVDDFLCFANGAFTRKAKDYINQNIKLSEMLASWTNAIAKVINKDDKTCKELIASAKTYLRRDSGNLSLQEITQEFIKLKESEGKVNHSQYCQWAVDKLCDFLNGDIALSDISMQMIQMFSQHLSSKGYSESYISSTLARLKAIINFAKNYGYIVLECNPFAMVKIRASRVRDCAIPVEILQKYRDAILENDVEIKARDVWMLSFYLCGVNFKDMMLGDFRGDEFIYIRSKVADRLDEQIHIPILPQAREIIDKYISSDGTLDFGYSFSDYTNLLKFFARKYRIAKDTIGMPQSFSYMSARKSFAQYASELGVPDAIIDYCLGHSLNKGGILRYYRRVTIRQAKAAMSRVFDYTETPSKYDDFLMMLQ